MSLATNVIPGVLAAVQAIRAPVPSGSPTPSGTVRSVHYGEQFRITGRGPVAWVMNASLDVPEEGSGDLEVTDWVVEVRFLYEFGPDQRHADEVLAALVEPFRSVLRSHRKLIWTAANSPTGQAINSPVTTVARARVGGGQWLYIVVNKVMYRMLTLNVLVREKVGVTYQAGG